MQVLQKGTPNSSIFSRRHRLSSSNPVFTPLGCGWMAPTLCLLLWECGNDLETWFGFPRGLVLANLNIWWLYWAALHDGWDVISWPSYREETDARRELMWSYTSHLSLGIAPIYQLFITIPHNERAPRMKDMRPQSRSYASSTGMASTLKLLHSLSLSTVSPGPIRDIVSIQDVSCLTQMGRFNLSVYLWHWASALYQVTLA